MHNRGKACYRRVDKGIINPNFEGFTKEEAFALAIKDEKDFQSWGWDIRGLERYSILIEPHELKQREERNWLNLENKNNLIWLKIECGENVTWKENVQNLDCLTKRVGLNLFYR